MSDDYKTRLENDGWISVTDETGKTLEASWGSQIGVGSLIGPVSIEGQSYFLKSDYFEANKTNPPQEVRRAFELVQEEMAKVFPQNRKMAFFTDQYQRVCASVPVVAGGIANYPIRSKAFRGIAALEIINQKDRSGNPKKPTGENISTYLAECEAEAYVNKATFNLYNRAAKIDDKYYIECCDKQWHVVMFSKDGWMVLEAQPFPMFARYNHMQQLIVAQKGSREAFNRFIDLLHVSKDNRILIEVYGILIGLAGVQQVILYLIGSQGSVKSTAQELLGSIYDPTITETLTLPHQQRELVQQLMHHFAPVFDNVDTISDDLASDLCRACTGGGFEKRQLYTDDDDLIYRYLRKVMLNGINVGNHRPDFIERCLIISQERVSTSERREKNRILKEAKSLLPEVRAYCFDMLVTAINKYEDVSKELQGRLPRMADFCIYGEAVARSLGYDKLAFYQTYMDLQAVQSVNALLSDVIGELVIAWVVESEDWKAKKVVEVTPNALHAKLKEMAEGRGYNLRTIRFPGSPTWLSNRLNSLKHSLAEYGIRVDTGIRGRRNNVYCFSDCSTSSTATQLSLQKEGGAISGKVEQSGIPPQDRGAIKDGVEQQNPHSSAVSVVGGGASGVNGAIQDKSSDTQLVERLPDSLGPTPRGGLASDNVKVHARCSLCGIYATCQLDKGTGERICATCATIEVTP